MLLRLVESSIVHYSVFYIINLVDDPSLKYDDVVKIVSTHNNLELNDSYLRNAAFQDAKAEYDSDTKKIIKVIKLFLVEKIIL